VTRSRFVWCDTQKRLVDADEFHSKAYQARYHAISDLPCPRFIRDDMEPVQSQLDGRLYDSKSALRATYKAAGVVEVGNDSSVTNPKPFKRPKPDRKEIRNTIDKAFSRAGLGA